MFNPCSTYRIQFHKDFTLEDFGKIIPYLQKLGVKTVYASPIFKATPGSMHGYDIVDPHTINPEIGDEKQLKKISKAVKDAGMKWLQDIVPNHMAYHPDNQWLMDVLEKGPQSEFVSFFDISWTSQLYNGRIMVPFLGGTLEDILKNNELKVDFENGQFVFRYYDNVFPLNPASYKTILSENKNPSDAVTLLVQQLDELLKIEDKKKFRIRTEEIKKQLLALANENKKFINECLKVINSAPQKLQKINDEQVYQLCHWKETNHQINFRRFFTINGLICLNIQEKDVFSEYHKLITALLKDGIFQGVRVDHVDGMNDPETYLKELRALAGDDTYIVVEKILENEESLPEKWPVQGTTGYDFLSIVNNLFSNNDNMSPLTDFYHKITNDNRSAEERIYEKKSNILFKRLAGELDNLVHLFIELDLHQDIDKKNLKATLAEFLIRFPVYRYYGNTMPLAKKEQIGVRSVLREIAREKPDLSDGANLLEQVWVIKPDAEDEAYNTKAIQFYKRVMQFTGPLMAKGVEDTLMYTYSRFIGHNEVGDSPAFDGLAIQEFHKRMKERLENWPLTMNTTSTHDTKRGEDVRMRLAVLTDIASEWMDKVTAWQDLNKDLKKDNAPDNNDEYFLYQTLIGSYPMPGEEEDNFTSRIEEYIPKALREAKKHTNWSDPDEEYEQAAIKFSHQLIDKKSAFFESFSALHKKVADHGILNSLSQVILKFTSPGIPDMYQGSELWDLSLVDPDNRRPVDFELREKILDSLNSLFEDDQDHISALWKNRYKGQIKIWLTNLLLQERLKNIDLFTEGDYIPLKVKGKYKDRVLAFCRTLKEKWFLTVVPLQTSTFIEINSENELPAFDWENTRLELPENAPTTWQNLLNGAETRKIKTLKLKEAINGLPLAFLKGESSPADQRGAGILLHITSLPSRFGVGDLGPEAYKFADFLHRTGQKYWQLLPLNPTTSGTGFSPYSSNSSMAGNALLISPEVLVEQGLLSEKDIKPAYLPPTDQALFEKAENFKHQLLEKAYENFKKKDDSIKQQYDRFCKKEKHWLHDFALFTVIKKLHDNRPWYEWPEDLKNRDKETLKNISREYKQELKQVKFIQFIFAQQWKKLKNYSNSHGINLFGDLPFYISHDSVDVWAHRDIFKVDEEGQMLGMAGVPPDYFNANGQLWGMPVFRWKILKKQNYNWWVQRIRKNIQLYDLVRLDHFRAFHDFWEVPASEKTAINGVWKKGPGKNLFKKLSKKLGTLPFVAEDLGDITEEVCQLRDTLNLPGMKVLQFAFGNDLPQSPHIPHNYTQNYIAYTGTHDNNTTVGWLRKDAGKTERKNLEIYGKQKISEVNVHKVLTEMVYSSVAKVAIIPMQDLLGYNENSRMNMPASTENNWLWRLTPNALTPELEEYLRSLTIFYNRQ